MLPIVAALVLALPAAAQPFEGLDARSIHIESFDGTRLAITVYRPTGATERLPVIVTQNRDEASESMIAEMRRYTDRGYVWIAQDRRGTGASFGVQTGFVNQLDAADAKAVMDWAAAQYFSTGKTVALGCSNQGAWQYLVATMQPASLVAIAPACSSPMFYDDAVAINGVPMIGLAAAPYAGECREGNAGARPGNAPPPAPRPVDGDADGALLRAAQAEQRCGAPMLGQYWLGMPRDGMNDYAGYQPALLDSGMTQWEAIRDSRVAILQLGGWFDAAVAGQIEGQRALGGRLVMGPWVHGNRPPRGVDFPAGQLDLTDITLRFFDWHTKGIGDEQAEPAILYYTVNAPAGQEWRSAQSWPSLPRSTLYLAQTGSLSPIAPGAADATVLDPAGARWFGGSYSALSRWYTGDFASTNDASLLHATPPMTHAVELTGTVTASLWISADRPDANVYAMLQDVAPDGSATYITDGRIRASWRTEHDLPWPGEDRIWHRGNASDIQPLVPGEPALLRFDFFPVSYMVRQGHSLRLAVSSGIGLGYDAPPLAGGAPVTVILHSGPEHPSALTLPMIAY
ncbi:MAG TPA: CocE/NonD family hydrolase [Paracoccaceae bacterium]|nr:CocE/NonD family hydrolase [Paracoccaceae bacterium]